MRLSSDVSENMMTDDPQRLSLAPVNCSVLLYMMGDEVALVIRVSGFCVFKSILVNIKLLHHLHL